MRNPAFIFLFILTACNIPVEKTNNSFPRPPQFSSCEFEEADSMFKFIRHFDSTFTGKNGEPLEPPAYWSELINDTAIQNLYRGFFLQELLNRHFHEGMSLASFSEMLGYPKWTDTSQFFKPFRGNTIAGHVVHNDKETSYSWSAIWGFEGNMFRCIMIKFEYEISLSADIELPDLLNVIHGDTMTKIAVRKSSGIEYVSSGKIPVLQISRLKRPDDDL
jgi:hypothetical protein